MVPLRVASKEAQMVVSKEAQMDAKSAETKDPLKAFLLVHLMVAQMEPRLVWLSVGRMAAMLVE